MSRKAIAHHMYKSIVLANVVTVNQSQITDDWSVVSVERFTVLALDMESSITRMVFTRI